ncbi:hypothetical protein GCM10027168_04420 [Streptomyces capparidis]
MPHRALGIAGGPRDDHVRDGRRAGTERAVPPGSAARRYFHWVETTKPPAMKPKPARMFQSSHAWTGYFVSVT